MWEKNRIARLAALALLLYALSGLSAARRQLREQQADTMALESRKEELLLEREELRSLLARAEDPELMRRLAWEKLRLVRPDETVFTFVEPQE